MLRKKRKIKYDLNRLRLVRRKNKLKAMYRRIKEKRRMMSSLSEKSREKEMSSLK